ncbi:MAG: hypothetical protein AVDCRST_MAG41-4273 [uncultured Corynebacteriales bacterium]|uniref:NmrA-like domain-containing protein n=1 Tax=uncultured Mycobacteriales bacterium TaxID=581187 RepID=A0A6J4JXE3_9ACTN|nr:MAG: hypothetical protein AVDCRST_MAG41-4273 [uncultured Corynebacteriales bacterium]
MPLTLLVHGATGTQGAPVVRRLLADGHTVRALVRRPVPLPAGAEPVTGDLADPAALAAAYADVDAVVVQLPLVFGPAALDQARAVLAGLEKARPPRVVFNTGGPIVPAPVGIPYLDARVLLTARLREVVERVAVVGPAGPYMENLSAPWSAPVVAAGELRYPLPEPAPVPWLALDDLAAEVADLLTAAEPAPVRVVAGPEALSGDRAAAAVAAALGRPVRWRTVSPQEYGDDLVPHLGEEAGRGIAAFYAPADGPPPAPDPALVRTGTTTLRAWAARQTWPAG